MSAQIQVDAATVRQFIEIVSTHAAQVINGSGQPGVLQLCRINPLDESIVPSRFQIGDIEEMVKTAIGDAEAGHNVYVETRTVQPGLRGKQRGTLEETAWVFGLVVDSDSDKGKGGNVTAKPSLAIETSPGNYHLWYLFTRAIPAAQAKLIGDAIRANSGADSDTGVITQCYRVAGTPNFPIGGEAGARAHHGGRSRESSSTAPACGTRMSCWRRSRRRPPRRRLPGAPDPGSGNDLEGDEATLPDDLLELIRNGCPPPERSTLFHSVVAQLVRRRWSDRGDRRPVREVPGRHRGEVRQAPAEGGRALLHQDRDAPARGVRRHRLGRQPGLVPVCRVRFDRRTGATARSERGLLERPMSSRPSASSMASFRARSRRPSTRWSPPAYRSSCAPERWSSRSARS